MFFYYALLFGAAVTTQVIDDPPTEWIDSATSHRVVRLSRDPGTSSLYFHQNAYTARGDKLLVTTPSGLSTIDLKSHAMKAVVDGRVGNVVVGRKSRQVFYTRAGSVYMTHLDTRVTRKVADLPPEMRSASGLAVNADDTLLAGSYIVSAPSQPGAETPSPAGQRTRGAANSSGLEARWALHLPMRLYTVKVKTGEIKSFHDSTEWLNHVQFSPTDPSLIMVCHEGPWHKVDRIWTIRADGAGLRKIHARTMEMEIAGHEFFSADGKTIWFDLQTPKSKVFWLAGFELVSEREMKYPLPREQWSVHYNISPDGKRFAGDGGGPRSVAAPGNGQWIYLYTPNHGKLMAEKLVDLSKHNYQLEPNVTFTPDGKWIVFRSNMHGATHVYAVEVVKTQRP